MGERALQLEEWDRMPTLGDIARHHGQARPDKIALKFESRATTFAQFDRHTNQAAQALHAEGIGYGDVIGYLGKNSDHYFELLIAASKIGAIMVPIGWRLSPEEVSYIATDAGVKLLFVDRDGAEIAARMEDQVKRIAMEAGAHAQLTYEAWRDAQAPIDPGQSSVAADVAVLLYTSGTTGKPKGVMLTNSNLLQARRLAAQTPMRWNETFADDVSMVAMPIAHIGGTGWGIVGLLNGITAVVVRDFNPVEILEIFEREGVAKLFMVPAALQFIVRLPQARTTDYSKLRQIFYGASPIPLELLRECMEVFDCEFVQQYGLTETCGTIVYLPPEDHDPAGNQRMRSAGLPVPGVEVRIQDANGNVLPVGEVGEIASRSSANMRGYLNNEGATRATIGDDGWLKTGDAGYMDADGYIYISDRIKDMIVSGAENVYPAEVESAIHGHPHVAEVAVIGVPDDTWGEAVKAIVVPKPGVTPDAASIIAYARERIAHYKAPKSVDVREQPLPRSSSGKILRRELREPFWAGRERRVN
ncbi:fatty acid--CoA ligase [Terricaulis sp.]|uniref:fatty acid--CoA ligase n=1 Tax=Terricaulis sp. TaxID=2768686 RepID=UPI003783B445